MQRSSRIAAHASRAERRVRYRRRRCCRRDPSGRAGVALPRDAGQPRSYVYAWLSLPSCPTCHQSPHSAECPDAPAWDAGAGAGKHANRHAPALLAASDLDICTGTPADLSTEGIAVCGITSPGAALYSARRVLAQARGPAKRGAIAHRRSRPGPGGSRFKLRAANLSGIVARIVTKVRTGARKEQPSELIGLAGFRRPRPCMAARS